MKKVFKACKTLELMPSFQLHGMCIGHIFLNNELWNLQYQGYFCDPCILYHAEKKKKKNKEDVGI